MSISDREFESEHRRSFSDFRHMVVFAALHVALTLGCVALAFVAHSHWMALLVWVAGTLTLMIGVAIHSDNDQVDSAEPKNYKHRL